MTALRRLRSLSRVVRATTAASHADVVLKSDGGGWVLDEVARELRSVLPPTVSAVAVTRAPLWLRRRVVHLVSGECFFDRQWRARYDRSNAIIGTWWHGSETSVDDGLRHASARLADVARELTHVHVPCRISRETVRRLGVPEEKIAFIPMGIDLGSYAAPPTASERRDTRDGLGISAGRRIVGVFQKDGVGWGEGLEPKPIKGPDLLLEVLERLAHAHPLHLVIPGPARGYVRRGLERLGIPYTAGYFSAAECRRLYRACDICLVPGREEGGPLALLEAMASGVAVVAHRVGMALDLIEDGVNGSLVDVGDVDGMTKMAERLLEDATLYARTIAAACRTVQDYAWPALAPRYASLYADARRRAQLI